MTAVAAPEQAPVSDSEAVAEDRARPRRWPLAVAAAAVVAAIVVGLLLVGGSGNASGTEAPAFALPSVREGAGEVSLADRGGRPAVVNFFASWCAPCRRELPALTAAAERFGEDVAFLGIAHQDARDDAIALLDEFGVDFPAGYDPTGSVAAAYGLRGLPATVFITADGKVHELRHGEIDREIIESTVAQLLDGRALRSNG